MRIAITIIIFPLVPIKPVYNLLLPQQFWGEQG